MGATLQDHECDVAIVGGGLAGAAAAVAFAQQGCTVRLFERRDLTRDPNRGDILHAPTVEILRRLGVLDLLAKRGAARFTSLSFFDSGGSFSAYSPVRESWLLNHAEMEAAFLESAVLNGVVVQDDVVHSLEPDPDSRRAGWLLHTENGSTSASFLVGADGAASLTRRTLEIPLEDEHEYDNWIVVLHSPTPSWLDHDQGWTLLHPDGTVWLLPTTPAGRHRVVVSVHRSEAKDWMTASEDALLEKLTARHEGFCELELNKRGGSHVYRITRRHAASYRGRRAAITGDAAHTLHPVGGQGLNIAIQDSSKLGELVGPIVAGATFADNALTQALEEYESVRRPINARTIGIAHAGSEIAGPGRDAYERAVAFYSRAASDPDFVREYHSQFGGGE